MESLKTANKLHVHIFAASTFYPQTAHLFLYAEHTHGKHKASCLSKILQFCRKFACSFVALFDSITGILLEFLNLRELKIAFGAITGKLFGIMNFWERF